MEYNFINNAISNSIIFSNFQPRRYVMNNDIIWNTHYSYNSGAKGVNGQSKENEKKTSTKSNKEKENDNGKKPSNNILWNIIL